MRFLINIRQAGREWIVCLVLGFFLSLYVYIFLLYFLLAFLLAWKKI